MADWDAEIGTTINPACAYVGQVITTQPDVSHLEGQTVGILANGNVLPEQVVTNGTVNVSSTYSLVHIGLPYYSDLETLKINIPLKGSTMQGTKVKVGNVTFHLRDSQGGYIGPDEDSLYDAFSQQSLREYSGQNLGANELYTGKIRQPLGAEYGYGGLVFYRQTKPLPITIGSIMPEVDFGGVSR